MRKIAEGCKTEEDFLKKLKATIPEIDFDELFGENDDDEEEEKGDDKKIKEDSTGGGEPKMFTYSCSIPMMEDIRKLSYKSQAEVCKAFHKFIKKGFPGDDSYLIKRFEESYSEIIFSHLDDYRIAGSTTYDFQEHVENQRFYSSGDARKYVDNTLDMLKLFEHK